MTTAATAPTAAPSSQARFLQKRDILKFDLPVLDFIDRELPPASTPHCYDAVALDAGSITLSSPAATS